MRYHDDAIIPRLSAACYLRSLSGVFGGFQDTKTAESTVGNTVTADLHGNYGRPGRSCMCTRDGVGLGCVASGSGCGAGWQGGQWAVELRMHARRDILLTITNSCISRTWDIFKAVISLPET